MERGQDRENENLARALMERNRSKLRPSMDTQRHRNQKVRSRWGLLAFQTRKSAVGATMSKAPAASPPGAVFSS